MLHVVSAQWWILLLRGVLAVALGVFALFAPAAAALAIAFVFGAYALIDGIIAIGAALRMSHAEGRWWWLLAEGIIGVIFGIAALVWPAISLLALVYLMAFWAIATGLTAITTAWRLRKVVHGEWLWIAGGIVSVIFGLTIIPAPGWGVLALVAIFAWYAIFFGIAFIGVALRLRAHRPAGARV
jgi:uncharacterized membrane protein HdeD (DUF308 family)